MTLDDLIALGDADFVRQAYRSVLGREADEAGFLMYLDLVRGGADKSQLLVALAASAEGRERHMAVEGLPALLALHDAPRPHRLRRAIRRLMQPFRPDPLEPVLRQQRALENRLYRLEAQLAEQTALLRSLEALGPAGVAGALAGQSRLNLRGMPQQNDNRLAPPDADRHYRQLLSARAKRLVPSR